MRPPSDWTDLDQAYLEAWGNHPDLSDPNATVPAMQRNARTGADRLEVEVHLEGAGRVAGECRLQWRGADGVWLAKVQYRSPVHNTTTIGVFRPDQVRKAENDSGR